MERWGTDWDNMKLITPFPQRITNHLKGVNLGYVSTKIFSSDTSKIGSWFPVPSKPYLGTYFKKIHYL